MSRWFSIITEHTQICNTPSKRIHTKGQIWFYIQKRICKLNNTVYIYIYIWYTQIDFFTFSPVISMYQQVSTADLYYIIFSNVVVYDIYKHYTYGNCCGKYIDVSIYVYRNNWYRSNTKWWQIQSNVFELCKRKQQIDIKHRSIPRLKQLTDKSDIQNETESIAENNMNNIPYKYK